MAATLTYAFVAFLFLMGIFVLTYTFKGPKIALLVTGLCLVAAVIAYFGLAFLITAGM